MRRFFPPLAALLILAVATVPALAIDPCAHPVIWKLFHPFRQVPPCPSPGPGPQPVPPGPPIPPVPPAPPLPVPTPVAGFRVLIVHDVTKDTPAITNELGSAPLHQYLGKKCVEYRILDQATNMANDNQIFQDAMKRPRASLPWLWMSDGSKVVEQALPTTVAEVVKLVDSYTPTPPAPVPPKAAAPQPEQFPLPPIYFPVPQQPVRDVLRGAIIFRMIRRLR